MKIIDEIAAERRRQIEQEHYDARHDDWYRFGELAGAAACYGMHGLAIGQEDLAERVNLIVRDLWPWHPRHWKPTDRRRDLIKAAALIVAEIERLDRKAAKEAAS
jgi:hypothetical protein